MTSEAIANSIRLIDDYLIHEGRFYSYDANIEPSLELYTARLHSRLGQGTPASVLVRPTAGLHESLAKQQEEIAIQRQRLRRIDAMSKNESLKRGILARLQQEYSQLDPKWQDATFHTPIGVVQRVHILRNLQRKARGVALDGIEVRIVVDMDWKGAPKTEILWLREGADWDDFLDLLKRATPQARLSSGAQETRNGEWLCRTRDSQAPSGQSLSPVGNRSEYEAMRERIRRHGSGAFMIHTSTMNEMAARRSRVAAIRSWKIKAAERGRRWALQNPLDEDLLGLEEMLS